MGTELAPRQASDAAPFFNQQIKPFLSCTDIKRLDRILAGVVITSFQRNPKLMACTKGSIISACNQIDQSGLYPDNGLQHAYLIPYKNGKTGQLDCQFMSGYRGLVNLAYQSGQIASVYAEVVRVGDEFQYEMGMTPKLLHRPAPGKAGKLTHAYAVGKTITGGTVLCVMEAAEVLAIRARSKSAGSDYSPWNSPADEPEMWKKTALRRLSKELPSNVIPQRVAAALEQEDAREFDFGGRSQAIIDVPAKILPEGSDKPDGGAAMTGAEGEAPEPLQEPEAGAVPASAAAPPPAMARPSDITKLRIHAKDTAKRIKRDHEDLWLEMKAKAWGNQDKAAQDVTMAEFNAAMVWLTRQKVPSA